MEKRLIYLGNGPEGSSSESIVAGAGEKMKAAQDEMMTKLDSMSPADAASWARSEVREIGNTEADKIKLEDGESKVDNQYVKQIFSAYEAAAAQIDANEKNARYDVKEAEVRATLATNETALGNLNVDDIDSLQLVQSIKDAAVALKATSAEVGQMDAPERQEKMTALVAAIDAQAMAMETKADQLVDHWRGRITEKDVLVTEVAQTLKDKAFPDPENLNALDTRLINLERMRTQYGDSLAAAGISAVLEETIAKTKVVVDQGQAKFRDYFSSYGDDTKALYEDLDEARKNMEDAQVALGKLPNKNSKKAGEIKAWLKGARDNYVTTRTAVTEYEGVLSRSNPRAAQEALTDQLRQQVEALKKDMPPEDIA